MMRHTRAAAAALTLAAGLAAAASGGPPADARTRPAVPILKGGYVGTFQSRAGNHWASELNITFQVGRKFSGILRIGPNSGIIVLGSLSGNNRITLHGRTKSGPRDARVRLAGTFVPNESGRGGSISGRYRLWGDQRERGIFRVEGGGIPVE